MIGAPVEVFRESRGTRLNSRPKRQVAMRKEPTTRLLHLARQFAAEPAGISLDEIVTRFSVSRRTAERTRDPIAEVFRQLEELAGERPKRWRLPNQALVHAYGHPAVTSQRQVATRNAAIDGRSDTARVFGVSVDSLVLLTGADAAERAA